MQRQKKYKVKKTNQSPSDPKKSFLAKSKFIIGDPSKGGHSEGLMVAYKTDGSKPDKWYSKDCKHFMQRKEFWSFEKYGLPYLRDIFKNGGDEHTKIDLSKTNKILIYPSVYAKNQQPIEVLFERRQHTVQKTETQSSYILLIPKRFDLRTNEQDKYFKFKSQDIFTNGKLDLEKTLDTIAQRYLKWENNTDPKGIGHMIVYEIATRKPIAELLHKGIFYVPYKNERLFSHSKAVQI